MLKQNWQILLIFFSQLCVVFALAKARPQGNATFNGTNTAGRDLVGTQNYAAGSKQVSYDVRGNTGPATFGDISGNSNRAGESSVAAGGGQSGTIKVMIPNMFSLKICNLFN